MFVKSSEALCPCRCVRSASPRYSILYRLVSSQPGTSHILNGPCGSADLFRPSCGGGGKGSHVTVMTQRFMYPAPHSVPRCPPDCLVPNTQQADCRVTLSDTSVMATQGGTASSVHTESSLLVLCSH
jgi:hypothetical protein